MLKVMIERRVPLAGVLVAAASIGTPTTKKGHGKGGGAGGDHG
jgi:hypothetical protein